MSSSAAKRRSFLFRRADAVPGSHAIRADAVLSSRFSFPRADADLNSHAIRQTWISAPVFLFPGQTRFPVHMLSGLVRLLPVQQIFICQKPRDRFRVLQLSLIDHIAELINLIRFHIDKLSFVQMLCPAL